MKCNHCSREAVGGFRKCQTCRRNDVESLHRRVARGSCRSCDQPKLIGYNFCHCCQIKNILRMRVRQDSVVRGNLYVLQTPRGIKIGRSISLARRIRQVSSRYFGGARLHLIAEYEGMGHLEPFVHVILNLFRIPEWREEFTCDLQTFIMAFDHVKVYEIFGKLHDLPRDPRMATRMAARQGINGGAASTAASNSSYSSDGVGCRARSRSSTRSRASAGSRARSRGASPTHAESEGEESS